MASEQEIKVGSLIKRAGYVQYADGRRYKVSKKTWRVSKVEEGKLFYSQTTTDVHDNEIVEDVELKIPKDDGEFIVVGDENGVFEQYLPKDNTISVGSVAGKYRVLKDVEERDWKIGDVVSIVGKVAFSTLENGVLEKVSDDTEHKHVLIVVDPISVFGSTNS